MGKKRCLSLICKKPNSEEVVFVIHRPYRCGCICISPKNCCGKNYMDVIDKQNNLIGSVGECWGGFCTAKFKMWDRNDKCFAIVTKNCCFLALSCCGRDIQFDILNENMEKTDKVISKKWGGLLKEVFSDADTFTVQFPKNLNVEHKTTLIASALLLDFMFF